MSTLEAELSKMQDIKPQLEQLTKTQEVLTAEKDELIREKTEQEEKLKVLEEKLSSVEKTKDEVWRTKIYPLELLHSIISSADHIDSKTQRKSDCVFCVEYDWKFN